MQPSFSTHLKNLRLQAKLTNHELARRANVPESLISGLQNENRRVGECQARRIGVALMLSGESLEQFIYAAIDTSTEKVLVEAQGYPAAILNFLAVQLNRAGFVAESLRDLAVTGDEHERDLKLTFDDGRRVALKTQLVCG